MQYLFFFFENVQHLIFKFSIKFKYMNELIIKIHIIIFSKLAQLIKFLIIKKKIWSSNIVYTKK